MYRAEASANKTLTKKWRRRNHARHRARLSSVRSRIDNSPPRPYAHLHVNLKKLQTEEERMSQIERDNRILLNKMSRIMRQRHTLDNSNSRYSARAGKPSLNRLKRKKELARITRENQRILARIQSVQPTYNHVAWEADRDRQKALLSNICEYPYQPARQPEPQVLSRAELEALEAKRRADEDEKVRMQLLKRPKKAPTFHQPRGNGRSDARPYSPDDYPRGERDDDPYYSGNDAPKSESPSRSSSRSSYSPRPRGGSDGYSPRSSGSSSSRGSNAGQHDNGQDDTSPPQPVVVEEPVEDPAPPPAPVGLPAGSVPPARVRVAIIEASDVANEDFDSHNVNQQSDPYVQVKIGKKKEKTETVQSSTRPVWNEVFEFSKVKPDDVIELKLMDDDTFSDDTIGVASLALSQLDLDVDHELWVEMRKDSAVRGRVRIKVFVSSA